MRCVLLVVLAVLALTAHGDLKDRSVEIFIKKTVENFKKTMKTGIPEIGMPVLDPLNVPIIDINIKDGVADVRLKIKDLMCTDLSTFNIKSLKVDLSNMRLSAVIVLPVATAYAQEYDLDGLILGFIPLYGTGEARFVINDLEIGIDTTISINGPTLQLGTFAIKLDFSQIQLYLEDILGGGELSDLVNTVINSLGKPIFDSQKGNIEWSLNNFIRDALNNELAKIDIGTIAYDNKNTALYDTAAINAEVDDFMKSVRPNLMAVDTVPIPDAKLDINLGLFRGYASVSDGTITGISTISREGDAVSATNPLTGETITAFTLAVHNLPVSLQSTYYLQGLSEVSSRTTGIIPFAKALVQLSTDIIGKKQLTKFLVNALSVPNLQVTNMGMFTEIVKALGQQQILLGIKSALETDVRRIINEGLA